MSPTSRTLALLRKDGWLCAVVEKWNPHSRTRLDLYGIGDVLAIRGPQTLLVQCTSGSNGSARVKKITEAEHTPRLREAGWSIEVHAWRKLKSGWAPRIWDLS